MDAVARFADEAAAFQQWAWHGSDNGERAARRGLILITRLYLAALDLPPPGNEDLTDQLDPERVDDAEWRAVFANCSRLPLDYYGEVFNPSVVPPEEPGVASLADDIADLYRDVVTGLRAYQSGLRAQAVWTWGFHFRCHWGQHVTGAIRVLQCWLAANAPDRLAAEA